MKPLFHRILFTAIMILSIGFGLQAQIVQSVHFTESDFKFDSQADGKIFIRSNKITLFYGAPNSVCLPSSNALYALPYGYKAKSVTFESSEKKLLMEDVDLANNPEEYEARIGATPNSTPTIDYQNSNEQEDRQNVVTSYWRGFPIAHVSVCPFVYEEGNLYFVEDITINIELEECPHSINLPENVNDLVSQLKDLVDNPEDVNELVSQVPVNLSASNRKINYLIITSQDLVESFQPLIEWKRKKGLKPYIMTVEEINLKYQGVDLQERIKKCIYHLSEEFGLEYVVLGGDDTVVPVRYCQSSNWPLVGNNLKYRYPTDLYYAIFDGNFQWNGDENEYFGTWDDKVGEDIRVSLTRIPVRTPEHVSNYITKILSYERGYNSTKWNYSILMTGALFGQDNRKDKLSNERLMSDAECQAELVYQQYIQPYWNGKRNRFFDTYSDLGEDAEYQLTKENLQTELAKSPMFVSMATHGSHYCVGLKDWHWFEYDENNDFKKNEKGEKIEHQDYDKLYTKEYAANLKADNYTLITTVACDTNMFDEESSGLDVEKAKDPCLSEVFIRNKESGIIGYLGSSRSGQYSPAFKGTSVTEKFEGLFYQLLFNADNKNFGTIVAQAKKKLCHNIPFHTQMFTVYPFNPVGDAEMPIFTEIPQEFEDLCIYLGDNGVCIETGTTEAIIAISDNSKVDSDANIYSGFAEAILPQDATICITKQNYKPRVYQVLTNGEILDFYQEIPLKEGYSKRLVAQLYPNQYEALEDFGNPLISQAIYSNGILHVELDSYMSNKEYTLTLRSIMGTETYNYSMQETSQDFNANEVVKGMYVLVLSYNGVELDSQKIYIK